MSCSLTRVNIRSLTPLFKLSLSGAAYWYPLPWHMSMLNLSREKEKNVNRRTQLGKKMQLHFCKLYCMLDSSLKQRCQFSFFINQFTSSFLEGNCLEFSHGSSPGGIQFLGFNMPKASAFFTDKTQSFCHWHQRNYQYIWQQWCSALNIAIISTEITWQLTKKVVKISTWKAFFYVKKNLKIKIIFVLLLMFQEVFF